ncbi:ABC transporter ATP-binding protein [Halomonas sp. KAO]|uniref:ABC transporter ATP-binding protein n=1 Tax=unclassified Halomonas TaxID=2609666 RepID=UPI00189E352F|nr:MULTISPECIES: ABC transporter ATP-binding protein [unclassified Halomonas]MBF7053194.1 ABC transporter ATP-binding protein [Halomonas sp. KAO]MDT0499417.1 ABC transporter ATP-binding protein [Halomonas sp. PAR7]MDT0510766.1 ABC transporter ATP-binding protein [Halomonas sp. LES1]MDT0591705.1 ABC transporter ATP-binding protein [Halomonas sp. PAR8]
MFANLRALLGLLTREQRRRLLRLQGLVVLMAFAEVGGVLAIGPFMALVGDMSRLQGDALLAQIYAASGIGEPRDFLFWMGVGVLVALALSAAISVVAVWRLTIYGQQLGAELSVRLYRHYMAQPWLFHAEGSSTRLVSNIAQETQRITDTLISPLMRMNAKAATAICMVIALVLFNPMVALIGLAVFAFCFVGLYGTVRARLAANGRAVSRSQVARYQLMAEGFGGIKDTLLLGRQAMFNQRFETASRRYGRAQGVTKALAQVPRYLVELVAFGTVIFLVLYLLAAHEGNLGTILPLLSVYALAGFKLLPAFQQIYGSVALMRGNIAAFEAVHQDLKDSRGKEEVSLKASSVTRPTTSTPAHVKLVPRDSVALSGVTFFYPGKEQPALDDVSLVIPAQQVIGLVGPSGSGKSTAIDLLLGLISPQRGELRVDGQPLTGPRKRAWQNAVGFVSQAIFLADASIRENIAFGLPCEEIDDERVRHAAQMAHLDELLEQLPAGLDTRVGERGTQLSGGQRQRIGIARALYDDAEVLILDEATSALDGITERQVMQAIHGFASSKTIIMIAHRLSTVRRCDVIYLMQKGKVVDQGSYDELVERNPTFQRMAAHS